MGKLNLLKGKYDGKVGQTVGAKWKNKATIRTFSVPANPKTEAQEKVRGVFAEMTTYVALFADFIKQLTALDTAGMSVRNAIIKLNKSQIDAGTFDKTTLAVSKGGLQKVSTFAAAASEKKVSATWTAPTATNFTSAAKLVLINVQQASGLVEVVTADASAGTITGSLDFETGNVDSYAYFLDKRGSGKVASASVYATTQIA